MHGIFTFREWRKKEESERIHQKENLETKGGLASVLGLEILVGGEKAEAIHIKMQFSEV